MTEKPVPLFAKFATKKIAYDVRQIEFLVLICSSTFIMFYISDPYLNTLDHHHRAEG